ncbi:MAG TPA: Spy/CpxP family protein refolding chaperone [Edaphobacter sp.]|nr:Spy/CpxP family protein refolding chaperone [Edaphobacter sp.]
MKTKIFQNPMLRMAALAICTVSLSAAPALVAQETSAPPPPPSQQQGNATPPMGHRGMGERHLQMMTKQLNLSPDQVSQIKAIDADTMTQMKALRQDTTTSRADKRSKMMEIHQASQDKIRNVLNDEQKTKFDAMQAKMQARRQGRHGGAGAPPPPPPQQ